MGGAIKKAANITSLIPGVGGGGFTGGAGKVGGLLGGGIGGFSGGIASGLPQFKGQQRAIDERAFNIEGATAAQKKATTEQEKATTRSDENLERRRRLLDQLEAQSRGEGPSLAQAQLRSASERGLAQQLAAAQSARGGSAASRERQLAQSQAGASQQLAQQAAEVGLQEQQQATQLLAAQTAEEQQLADNLAQKYLAQGFSMEQAQQQAAADLEALKTQQFLSAQGLSAAGVAGAQKAASDITGGLFSGAGSLAALSDKRQKYKVKKADGKSKNFMKALSSKDQKKGITSISAAKKKGDMGNKKENEALGSTLSSMGDSMSEGTANSDGDAGNSLFEQELAKISDKRQKEDKSSFKPKQFLDALQAYEYEYKNPGMEGAGEGKHFSVMAQDLEKAGPVGRSMVKEEDGVKMVDYAKGFGAILAAQTHLNKRLEELESKKKKRRS